MKQDHGLVAYILMVLEVGREDIKPENSPLLRGQVREAPKVAQEVVKQEPVINLVMGKALLGPWQEEW